MSSSAAPEKNRFIEIYDTTLRDGSQGEGVNFSVTDKLRIAEKLDAFGVQYIEGGWPGSNPKDMEFFLQAKSRTWKNSKLAAFGSTRRKNVRVEEDPQVRQLLEAETPVITIFGKTWDLHVTEVLKTTLDENVKMIAETIRFLKDQGKTVIYDAEHTFDGLKADPDYGLSTMRAAAEAGADVIALCDTNGGCLPSEVIDWTKKVLAISGSSRVGIHTHNDIGLAVANALVSVEAGATQVQGTINGYGERTGNCNLVSVIPNLALKMGLSCVPAESLGRLTDLSQFVDEITNLRPDVRQPWVGATAFAHKGGMHVNAVQKIAHSFEHINPECVGNTRRILVSDLSGKSNILMKAEELGIDVASITDDLGGILKIIKDLEHQGYEFEAAEASLGLLIMRALRKEDPPFKVDAYHVSMRGDHRESVCEATIKVRVGDKVAHTVADGDGPVNALDGALRLGLVNFYPELNALRLTDYKVRILDSSTGTASMTRVLIESTDGKKTWSTVGVSGNIVEASLKALSDSLEYWLLRYAVKDLTATS